MALPPQQQQSHFSMMSSYVKVHGMLVRRREAGTAVFRKWKVFAGEASLYVVRGSPLQWTSAPRTGQMREKVISLKFFRIDYVYMQTDIWDLKTGATKKLTIAHQREISPHKTFTSIVFFAGNKAIGILYSDYYYFYLC